MTEPKTIDPKLNFGLGGDNLVRLEHQRVVIEDRIDGEVIVLEPAEAEALRRWLAEFL